MLPRQAMLSGLFVTMISLSISSHANERDPPLAVAPFDTKAAENHQQAWAKHLKVDVEIKNSIGLKLRLIPPGEFTMGSPLSENDRGMDEQQHNVRITKAFYLGKYEVTQGEWKAVMETEPWKGAEYVKTGDDYPVTHVSWDDAVEFCKKLSRKEGKEYRLPTEAEWEYACRGGKTTRFHFGNVAADLGDYAWYGAFSDGNAKNELYAHRVGLKRPNPFGLHDTHGNVRELCKDWYDAKYYANSPLDNPPGPETRSYRVDRGGGWSGRPVGCRSACRPGWDSPSYRPDDLGFRLARSSKE